MSRRWKSRAHSVPEDAAIRLLGDDLPYVSRGGLKLAAALDHWKIEVTGRACLDIGASTGGFTDCLLQHGAAHVTAVDTGFGQIAMKLRNDPRVRLVERTNARFLAAGALCGSGMSRADAAGDGCVVYLGDLAAGAGVGGGAAAPEAVILVKPQFEVGRGNVGKGGIVRDPEAHQLGR